MEFDLENDDDDDDLHFAKNGAFSKERQPKRNHFKSFEDDTDGILILGTQKNTTFNICFVDKYL